MSTLWVGRRKKKCRRNYAKRKRIETFSSCECNLNLFASLLLLFNLTSEQRPHTRWNGWICSTATRSLIIWIFVWNSWFISALVCESGDCQYADGLVCSVAACRIRNYAEILWWHMMPPSSPHVFSIPKCNQQPTATTRTTSAIILLLLQSKWN